jgi:hypothetical protein
MEPVSTNNATLQGSVYCYTCNQNIIVVTDQKDYWSLVAQLEAGLMASHATSPHSSNHKMVTRIEIDNEDMATIKYFGNDLRVICLRCGSMPQNKATFDTAVMNISNLPMWLVNSAVLSFHTAHEGHPIHVRYGEWNITSPVGNQPALLQARDALLK